MRFLEKVNMFVCVFIFMLSYAYAHGLQVNTTEGVVEGFKSVDGKYFEFYGIPYAGPTDGNNRFKGPVPPKPHSGVLLAINSSILCAQPSANGLIGIENCLTLNIFTKNVTTPKPVVVFLNAEDYTSSSTPAYTFKTFVEQDIVFVSMNFRLSVFGFLCLGIKEAPGNAGLRDVLQGLKWINSNIAHFGGDPKNVVLMGHASGAAIVDLITMARPANGLVNKAIALSGSSLAPWAVAYDPIGYAELLGAKLGYKGKTKQDLAKYLIKANNSVLNKGLLEFSHFKNNTPLFAPCIENLSLNPKDVVLSDAPIHLIRSGSYLQIPYITGYTTREGTMRINEAVNDNWLKAMSENFTQFLPADLKLNSTVTSIVVNKTIGHYFGKHNPLVSMKNIDDYLRYEGDTLVIMPVIRGAKERTISSKAEVRLLVFGYIGTYDTEWKYKQIPINGVRHGGILNYLFDYDLKPADKYVTESLVHHFTSFAKTGKNNAKNIFEEWLPTTSHYLYSLDYAPFGEENFNNFVEETRDKIHAQTMKLWDEIYNWLYKPPQPVNYSGRSGNSSGKITNSLCLIFSSVVFVMISRMF